MHGDCLYVKKSDLVFSHRHINEERGWGNNLALIRTVDEVFLPHSDKRFSAIIALKVPFDEYHLGF